MLYVNVQNGTFSISRNEAAFTLRTIFVKECDFILIYVSSIMESVLSVKSNTLYKLIVLYDFSFSSHR